MIWGALHGAAIVIHRIWRDMGLKMWGWLGWLITFNFVNIAWVFFRAKDFEMAEKVLGGMVGAGGVVLPDKLAGKLAFLSGYGVEFGTWIDAVEPEGIKSILPMFLIGISVLFLKNSEEWSKKVTPKLRYQLLTALFLAFGILSLSKISQFLYFQF